MVVPVVIPPPPRPASALLAMNMPEDLDNAHSIEPTAKMIADAIYVVRTENSP
jgi:hypothetical protein